MILLLNTEESKILLKHGSVELTRNGVDIVVEESDGNFKITLVNPYEDVVLEVVG